jgi:hypothetical protein
LAEKIAKQEKIIQTSSDKKEIAKAENEIMRLSSCVSCLEDMIAVDEMVLEILEKK